MPRACLKCGHQNPDDVDFCQECGEYVRWELSGVVKAVPAPPPEKPPPGTRLGPAAAAPPAAPEAPAAPQTTPPQAPAPSEAPTQSDGAGQPADAPRPATAVYGAAEEQAPAEPELPPLEPDAVVVTLRLPEQESATGAHVTTTIEAGGYGTLVALVRNQSGIVDNYDLSISGMPAEWWTITPSTVYLVPYGAPGGEYEQEVMISFSPPRAAEAEARPWDIQVVATSKAHGVAAGAANATIVITPYQELESEMRPQRRSGRRWGKYAIAVRNRANSPIEAAVAATDPDQILRFAFKQPVFPVNPGRRNGTPFIVRPPKQIWIGRKVERRFEVTAQAVGSESASLPQHGAFVQKPWLPWWLLILIPLLIVAAVLIFLLMPKKTTVPDLAAAKSVFAAQTLLDEAGLELGNQTERKTDKSKPGSILKQSPAAGEEVEKGTAVSIEVAVSTGRGIVPDLKGMTLADAERALSEAGFVLGKVQPEPKDPNTAKVGNQIPKANASEQKGKPVDVFLATAKGGKDGAAAGAGGGGDGGGEEEGGGGGGGDVTVPAVHELDQKAAGEALTKLGLTFEIVEQFSSEVPVGQVISQDPHEGTKVPKGTKVTLVFSRGRAPDIVFDQDGNLFIVSSAPDQEPRPIAKSDEVEEEAAVNAAGNLVAYRRGTDDSARIFLVNPADPTTARPLTDEGFVDGRPAFSSDGKVIAFIRGKEGGDDDDLCFVRVSGGKPSCIEDAERDVSRPAWAPDGSAITVVAFDKEDTQIELLLYTAKTPASPNAADWTDQGLITDSLHGTKRGEQVFYSAWTPDGKSIAFTANWGRDFAFLHVSPVKTGILEPPKKFPDVRACEIAWRPDGLQLAFARRGATCDDVGEVVIVDPAKPKEQTVIRAGGGNPAWAPVARG